jgi:hypothetical protein
MNTFLTLLATFYVCDALLAEGPLDHTNQIRCAATFETLKLGFLTDAERKAVQEIGLARGADVHAAFARFEQWEQNNADLVSRFREEAETVALTMR